MNPQELIDLINQEAKNYSQEKNEDRFRHLEVSRQEILKEYIEDDFIAGTTSQVVKNIINAEKIKLKVDSQVEMINLFIDDIHFACNIDGLEQFSDAYNELIITLDNRKKELQSIMY